MHIIHFSSAAIIRSMKEHGSSRESRNSAIRCRSCSWLGDKLCGIHVDYLFLYPRSDNRLRMVFFEQFGNLAKFLDVLYMFFLTSSTKSSTIGSRLRPCQTFLGALQVPFFYFSVPTVYGRSAYFFFRKCRIGFEKCFRCRKIVSPMMCCVQPYSRLCCNPAEISVISFE